MKKFIYAALAFSPVLALADAGTIVGTATTWAHGFNTIINILIPAVFGLAIIYFFYGVAVYILAAGDPKKASEGKSIIIYGLIAIAVLASLYGLINFLQSSIGVNSTGTVDIPVIPSR